MRTRRRLMSGFSLVELLVSLAIIGVLAALLLSAVQQSRESARRISCQNHLKQIGLAILNYNAAFKSFPPGWIGENPDVANGKGWGWGTLVLPFLEQTALHDQLEPSIYTLGEALAIPEKRSLLQTRLSVYRCPSDNAEDLSHTFHEFTALAPIGPFTFHPPPPQSISFKAATSNYVASFGAAWDPTVSIWSLPALRGNGVFGCNTHCRLAEITDGTSHTFAVGERTWANHAAVWSGIEWWNECTSVGIPMVASSVFFKMNGQPQAYYLSCDGQGSAGFSSRHVGGSQFVMCDGSVQFVSSTIDFQNAVDAPGLYQRLGSRNDGKSVSLE